MSMIEFDQWYQWDLMIMIKKRRSITSSETWSKIKVRFECDRSDSRIVVNEDCDKDEDRSHVYKRKKYLMKWNKIRRFLYDHVLHLTIVKIRYQMFDDFAIFFWFSSIVLWSKLLKKLIVIIDSRISLSNSWNFHNSLRIFKNCARVFTFFISRDTESSWFFRIFCFASLKFFQLRMIFYRRCHLSFRLIRNWLIVIARMNQNLMSILTELWKWLNVYEMLLINSVRMLNCLSCEEWCMNLIVDLRVSNFSSRVKSIRDVIASTLYLQC